MPNKMIISVATQRSSEIMCQIVAKAFEVNSIKNSIFNNIADGNFVCISVAKTIQRSWRKCFIISKKHMTMIAENWDKTVQLLINNDKHKGKKHAKAIKMIQQISNNTKKEKIIDYYIAAKRLYLAELEECMRKNMISKQSLNRRRNSIISAKPIQKMINAGTKFEFMPSKEKLIKMIYETAGVKQQF